MDPHTAARKGLGLELKVLSSVPTTTTDTRAYLDFIKLLPRATPERGGGEKRLKLRPPWEHSWYLWVSPFRVSICSHSITVKKWNVSKSALGQMAALSHCWSILTTVAWELPDLEGASHTSPRFPSAQTPTAPVRRNDGGPKMPGGRDSAQNRSRGLWLIL